MTSIKIKFRPSTVDGKEGGIYFQIIHNRVVRQLNTEYKLFAEEWNAESESIVIKGNRSNFLLGIQERLSWDLARLEKVVRTLDIERRRFTADNVITMFHKLTKESSLFNFMHGVIAQLKQLGKIRTSETYTATLKSLMAFRENHDVPLDGISSYLMLLYEAHLKARDVRMNTISFYMRNLRAVYNRAVEKELTPQNNPFRHVYTGVDKTVKRAVPVKVIKALKELNLSMKSSLDFARDMFMFSFYMRGMPFVDMAFLKKSDLKHGTICYSRKKTHQLLKVEWVKELQDIVNRYAPLTFGTPYMLPIISRADGTEYSQYRLMQEKVNRYLKKIGAMIALKIPLTTYVARHSWASMARNMDFSIAIISEAMGHNSYRTTQIYLNSIDLSKINQANRKIIRRIHAK